MGLLTLVACSRGGSDSHRLTEFNVEFGDHNIPTQMTAGETVTAEVVVKNAGRSTWPSKPNEKGHNAVNLSYHWLDRRKAVVAFDGLRTPLLHDVGAGQSVELKASILTPDRAGQYTLEITLVQEAVTWFPERDGDKLVIPVTVVEARAEDSSISGTQTRTEVGARGDSKKKTHPEKTRKPVLNEKKAIDPATKKPGS